MSKFIPDYSFQNTSSCFPLYWYEENKNPQASLLDDAGTRHYIRRDSVTDWILKEVRYRFGGSRSITKEHTFYYVYELLHSTQYSERFADDLKKSLPHIPIVDNMQTTGQDGDYAFFATMPMLAYRFFGVKVSGDIDIWQSEWTDATYQHFAMEKMRFAKVRDEKGKLVADKSKIIYNDHITIENIPLKAYEHIVNGKSALERVMERYTVTINKAFQIKNGPNDWQKEHEQPRYILDLLLSVITLSCKTVDIINALPKLNM